ncbi:hypothetical protein D3C76_716230 [compost metagenome]
MVTGIVACGRSVFPSAISEVIAAWKDGYSSLEVHLSKDSLKALQPATHGRGPGPQRSGICLGAIEWKVIKRDRLT